MSRDLDTLVPEFREKFEKLLIVCKNSGFTFVPFYTLRTPQEQARLWRQSRSRSQIDAKISELRSNKCNFLADCIEGAGPQNGRRVTGAIPGQSWHNWGEACDAFLLSINGSAIWNEKHIGYEFYAQEAIKLGLTSGRFFKDKKGTPMMDSVHVQLRKSEVPQVYNIREVNDEMEKRFNN